MNFIGPGFVIKIIINNDAGSDDLDCHAFLF